MYRSLRTGRSQVQLEWSLPPARPTLASRRLYTFSQTSSPRTCCGEKKGGTRRQYSRSLGWGDRLGWRTRGGSESCFPPRVTASLCTAIQLGSTGTRGGLQFCAADEPDASSSAEVNHRYTTGVSVRQHNTAALLTLGLLKRTGRETFF